MITPNERELFQRFSWTSEAASESARLAGHIEGQQEAMGIQFAFEDLLIGATALHLGYEVATLNLRDFQRIPGLSVIQL